MERDDDPPRKRKLEKDEKPEKGEEGEVTDLSGRDKIPEKRSRKLICGKDPGKRENGQTAVRLVSNHFPIQLDGTIIFMHHMHFEPIPEGQVTVSRHIKDMLLRSNREAIGDHLSWGELLITRKDLSEQKYDANINGVQYTMTLSQRIMFKTDSGHEGPRGLNQTISILLKSILRKRNYSQLKRIMYNLSQRIDINGQMYAVPGFFTNIDYFNGGLLLNLDIRFRFLHQRSVLDTMNCSSKTGNYQKLQMLTGETVITLYEDKRGGRTFYVVTGVDFGKTPKSTFTWMRKKSNGQLIEETISFAQYYHDHHNRRIRDMEQPLLVSSNRRRRTTDGVVEEQTIYLVPELCALAGLTEELRTDSALRRDIKKKTSDDPMQRLSTLTKLVDSLHKQEPGNTASADPGALLRSWGIKISKEPLRVLGRCIPPEPLMIYKRNPTPAERFEPQPGNKRAIWLNLFGEPPRGGRPPAPKTGGLFSKQPLTNWAIVHLDSNTRDADTLAQTFHRVKEELCLEINDPKFIRVRQPSEFSITMRQEYDRIDQQGTKLGIMVVILPTGNVDHYKKAKEIMLNRPVAVQAVLARTLGGKNLESKCKAILQQIVCKLGGAPWAVKILYHQPTMIVGIDVSHSKTTNQDSFLALVATINRYYTEYYSDLQTQPQEQDMSATIGQSFQRAIQAFQKNSGAKPERVIIYRDDPGGRGSLDALMENEVEILQQILLQANPRASLCFIVVRKRGLTRLFKMTSDRPNMPSKFENPDPGTIVDTQVVSQDYNDFYLVSHFAASGTVTPTQYQIVYRTENDDQLNTGAIQELTFKLCHTYYNFMGTISQPAPLRYADRLAGLMRQTLGAKGGAHPNLSTKLYYL